MRNVRSVLLAAVVGLSLTTACSFSSSRSWGSAATPNSGPNSKGKPALQHSSKGKPAQQHSSNGKPAQKTPAAAPTPAPTPAPPPTPAPAATPEPPAQPAAPTRVPRDDASPTRVPRDESPTRVPRDDTSTSPAAGKSGARLGTKPAPAPAQPIDGGAAKQPPRGLSIAPSQPDPKPRSVRAAPNQ